eukprot:GHVT01000652.1.p1 GENE.GHVT01000652.1~~GHVT01000652.1.p1  ORF type:complete len:125 (+),score=37.83 GHVT01000652.1:158-532(+)
MVHLTLNHERRHLPLVLRAQPGVVDATCDLMKNCKWDKWTVIAALDVLWGILEFHPGGRQLLFEKDVIERLDECLYVHEDSMLNARISWMIEHYFDDLGGMEEEQARRTMVDEQPIIAQLSSNK